MPVKFQFTDQKLKAWVLCHQAHNSVSRCEDVVFAKVGLTSQKLSVFMAIAYMDGPATVSSVAHYLDRNANGVSMIIDRMAKDGLVESKRDLPDRRAVRLVITKKVKEIFEQATMLGWELIEEVLSCLSDEDIVKLNSLLDRVRSKAFEYLYPGKELEEVQTQNKETVTMSRFLAKMARHRAGMG